MRIKTSYQTQNRLSDRPRLRRLGALRDNSGSIAILGALVLPMMMTIVFGTIDFVRLIDQRQKLQIVVDNASLAAAKGLSLSSATADQAKAVVNTTVSAFFDAQFTGSTNNSATTSRPNVKANVNTDPLQVQVNAKQPFESVIGTAFGLNSGMIEAQSTAQVVGQPNLCVLVLNPKSNGALDLQHSALVTGNSCAVFVNSTHNIGIKAKNSARMKADTICSAGGYQGKGNNFDPKPFVDCPQFDDPLSGRISPKTGTCDPTLPTQIFTSQELQPGTYCQNVTIGNGAVVNLAPGTYVFQGADLVVENDAEILGTDVGLYFDKDSSFRFDARSKVSLEAPLTGAMAGLVIFTARDMPKGTVNFIYSEQAQNLVGTIYMPTAELRIDGSANIGGDAAYTAMVVHDLRIYGGPHVILNTDYHKTDVPVPAGIKGAGQPVRLIN